MPPDEVAFMGRITAGMTHELRNVLAVIGESAGLMEDVLALSGDDPVADRDRLVRIIGRILQHVQRGTVLLGGLNRFAHTPEARDTVIDVPALLEQLVTVTTWFGREKRVSLGMRPTNSPVKVLSDPMKVQMVLFAVLEAALVLSPAVESIEVAAEEVEGDVAVEMALAGPEGALDHWDSRVAKWSGWPRVGELADELGARLELDGSARRLRLRFGQQNQFDTI